MSGWVKLYRVLIKKPIWLNSTPEHKSILITILLLANHEKSEWEWMGEKFSVVPGQFVTSLESIRKKTGKGISTQNVRSCLKRLQKLQFATDKATKAGRLITIINWDSYQPEEKKATKIVTDDQQRTNKGPTPNKNDKNERMKEQTPLSDKSAIPMCPQKLIRDLYNEKLPFLPVCKSTNKTVDGMVRTRWKEDTERQDLVWWENYFKAVGESNFLTGKVNGFQATFEWLVRPTNMSKIINGNYKNREEPSWTLTN